jgi:hypothetical protein
MINRYLLAAVWLMSGWMATAQVATDPMIFAGTRTINVDGLIDDDGDDVGISLNLSMGWFVADYVEVGGKLSLGFRGSDNMNWGLAGYGEYHIDQGYYFVPYVGASLGLQYLEIGNWDETYLELQTYGGVRYFFTNYAAIGTELALKYATEEIYNRFQDSFDWEIRLKTSWYF